MSRQTTRFIEIKDFTPGIFSDLHGYSGAKFSTANDGNKTSLGLNSNGGATVDGTVGCTADTSGALVPLPKKTAIQSAATDDKFGATGDATGTTYYPANLKGPHLLDARVVGFVGSPDDSPNGSDAVYMAWGAIYDPAGTSTYKQYVFANVDVRDPAHDKWVTFFFNKYDTVSAYKHLPAGSLWPVRQISGYLDSDGYPEYTSTYVINVMGFLFCAGDATYISNQLADGWPQTATALSAAELALTNYDTTTGETDFPLGFDPVATGYRSAYMGVYPNPNLFEVYGFNPAGASEGKPRIVATDLTRTGYIGIGHQGRAVVAGLDPHYLITSEAAAIDYPDSIYALQDRIWYSPVYNMALNAGATHAARQADYSPRQYNSIVDGDENVHNIGVMGSISASELLVVKHAGGGVLMRGDMDNPEAVALPYLESTYGVISHGVGTPIGYVYGSRNGVFLWSGGQASEKISNQLHGFFWNHATYLDSTIQEKYYIGNRGRFGYWHPLVAVPNNYLFNTITKSWWRLEDPDDVTGGAYNVYEVSPTDGSLYAFPHRWIPGEHYTYYNYDKDTLRDTYSWKSLPLVETLDRYYSVQDVELTITTQYPFTGQHSITVTLYGYDVDGNQVASPAMTINMGTAGEYGTQIIRTDITGTGGAFNARYIQVYIQVAPKAGAVGDQGPAPKVHAIRVGVRDNQSVA